MKPISDSSKSYFDELKKRSGESKVYSQHQLLGLEIAVILRDWKHKALYIKLAKEYNPAQLMSIAKGIAEKRNVQNAGAYFMKVLKESNLKKISKSE